MPCCTVCELRPRLPGALLGTGSGAGGRPSLRIRSPLDGRVLDALAAEPDGVLGFQGLRRRLGAHPESLSRSLHRLEEAGFAERTQEGYRATEEGACEAQPAPAAEAVEVLRVPLPPDLDAAAVADLLEGRWSGSLRPYGRSDGPGETTLLFLREPAGTLVRVRLLAGLLLVEAEGGADADLLADLFALLALLSGVTGSGPTPSSSAKRAHTSLAAPAAESTE